MGLGTRNHIGTHRGHEDTINLEGIVTPARMDTDDLINEVYKNNADTITQQQLIAIKQSQVLKQ